MFFYNKNKLNEKPSERLGITTKEFLKLSEEERRGIFSKYSELLYGVSDVEIKNPILDGDTIREKTPTELKLENPELLEEGEYINGNEVIVVAYTGNFLKKKWNKETHVWEEGASHKSLYENRLTVTYDILKKVLYAGYEYIDNNGEKHLQAVDETTVNFLGNTILMLKDKPQGATAIWRFDMLGYDKKALTLEECQAIRDKGQPFIDACYDVKDDLVRGEEWYITEDKFLEELKKINQDSILFAI